MAMVALPVSSAKEVIFIHMTDVHLCETEFAEGYYDTSPGTDPLAFFNEMIDEIKSLNPDGRVAEPEGVSISPQGDLIAVGSEEYSPEDDEIVASTIPLITDDKTEVKRPPQTR